jgi:hypothetical protein
MSDEPDDDDDAAEAVCECEADALRLRGARLALDYLKAQKSIGVEGQDDDEDTVSAFNLCDLAAL